jgi:isopentenyl diphosphate isomerase/L-lactate dehydrogenase-like FMN-dependent dehydrogenase
MRLLARRRDQGLPAASLDMATLKIKSLMSQAMMARTTPADRLSRRLGVHGQLREEPMFGPRSASARSRVAEQAESIAALRRAAARRLPKAVFDFIDGAAGDETTLRDNEAAFREWLLLPRVAVDVSRRTLQTSIVGSQSALPLLLSPIGLAGFFWPGGEIAAARAAASAGIPFCLSTNSVASIEEVAAAVPDSERWFQLYFLKDRDWMNKLMARSRSAGYRVLCMTVDLPLQGRRERDIRNAFTVPLRPRLASAWDLLRRPRWLMGVLRAPPRFGNFQVSGSSSFTSVAEHVGSLFDPTVSWTDIARLRERWAGPVVIKGILHPDDARRAVEIGADAVMVSNHGGRQLDRVPAAITALPDIVAAVDGRVQVILDGGVRRGTDIVVARALGAAACSVGRAFVWGLAAAGQQGVERAISILRDELDTALALIGAAALPDLTGESVRRRGLDPQPDQRRM